MLSIGLGMSIEKGTVIMANVWLWNHYATDMYKNHGGRHYWFAENLIKRGHKATVFGANTYHNTEEFIDTRDKKYATDTRNGIPFVFVRTTSALGNGMARVKNMLLFYRNLFPVAKAYAKLNGKPDIILASSVHPLTMVAGIQIARKFKVPCICEVRDLWPETLVKLGKLSEKSILAKFLYKLERYIYSKADSIVFTMEGGKKYIDNKGWTAVCENKVNHINNGTDLETYNRRRLEEVYVDADLDAKDDFKVMYAGSLGQANAPSFIVQAAKIIQDKGYHNIKFIIFGEGLKEKELKDYCANHQLENITFKEKVDKKFIPCILHKGDLNLFTGQQTDLYDYGLSLNKMFDYMASGKPMVSNIECGYDILKRYNCGITVEGGSSEKLVEGILKIYELSKEDYGEYCENALNGAKDYDFKKLTAKLEIIINETTQKYKEKG